jgi:S-adenosylmethionine:tRNA ribosyltransferase-isomerase
MRSSELEYKLPAGRVAQFPSPRREQAKLLLVRRGRAGFRHHRISELPKLLEPGDLLVVNDTKVLPARLLGFRQPGGGKVEALLLQERGAREWEALLRPARRMRAGTALAFAAGKLRAQILEPMGNGLFTLRFTGRGRLRDQLARFGQVPLPPYIRRSPVPLDRQRYQTVYARVPGAVAAPTAGLHLTRSLLARLDWRGVRLARLTLQVGAGTFTPIRTEQLEDHAMEAERMGVPLATLRALRAARRRGGRVIAVGTTVVRALESLTDAELLSSNPIQRRTDLMITPGFRFRIVDGLMTNFHLPRSTLLALVMAFAGIDQTRSAYAAALAAGYRFYSYGDAMLILC